MGGIGEIGVGRRMGVFFLFFSFFFLSDTVSSVTKLEVEHGVKKIILLFFRETDSFLLGLCSSECCICILILATSDVI